MAEASQSITPRNTHARPRKGITDGELMAALKRHAGIYSLAARDLGCDRTNVLRRVERSPALQAWCAQIEQEVGDAAEAVIKNSIIKGDVKTAKWYAERKLRDRGFSTRTELTGPNGGPLAVAGTINVQIEYVDAKDAEDVL